MQTPIPSPIRSPRNDLSSDKTISEEFADTVTLTTATSSKTPSTTTRQKKSFTLKTRHLPESIAGMCRRRGLIRSHIKTKFITREIFVEKIKEVIQHCDNIVPELTVTTTNEMIKKEMPRLVKLAVNKDREVSPVIYLDGRDGGYGVAMMSFSDAISGCLDTAKSTSGGITVPRSYALSWKPCQGDSLNLPDHRIHKDGDGDALFQLKSDSLPHAHAQTTKTYYKH
ncbi:hypothetical protein Tco_1516885 [Tanacetum coccineum]